MPQTSISDAPARAYAGQLSEGAPRYCRSYAAEGAIVAGQPVLFGTDPDTQVIAIADSDTLDATTFAGFAVLDTSRPPGGIADEDPVSVIRHGVVYLEVTGTVVAGNPVFVGNATAQLGDIDDAAGTGLTEALGCRFLQSGTSGDCVAVYVNLQ